MLIQLKSGGGYHERELTIMKEIASILIISTLTWLATGYDLFILMTVTSMAIELYKGFYKVHTRINKILKMIRKTVK